MILRECDSVMAPLGQSHECEQETLPMSRSEIKQHEVKRIGQTVT